MDKLEIQGKIKLKKHEFSLEKDANRKSKLYNDIQILELRFQIENFKERIESLQNRQFS